MKKLLHKVWLIRNISTYTLPGNPWKTFYQWQKRWLLSHWKSLSFIVGFVLTISIGMQHPLVWDVTKLKNNSLKSASLELVATINKPLKIELFTPDRQVAADIQEVIEPFKAQHPAISLEVYHKTLSPEEKLELKLDTDHNLRITYEEKTKGFEVDPEHWNEENFRNYLSQILRQNDNFILFLSNHAEPDLFAQGNRHLGKLSLDLRSQGIKIASINLGEVGVIPENTDVLVINDSKTPLLPKEIALILAYLQKGGNLLWCVDPYSLAATKESLAPIAEYLGISWLTGTIQDHKAVTLGAPDPNICVILDYPSHPITQKFGKLTVFPWATPLEYKNADKLGWTAKPLLLTSRATSLKDGKAPQQGPFTLSVSLTKGSQRVLVIGNSHFLSNASIHNYGNQNFANDIFNWVSQNENLVTTAEESAFDPTLSPSPWTTFIIHYGYTLVLPAVFLILGFCQKRLRQKKYQQCAA